MPIFIKCNTNTNFNDGIGAIAQAQLHTYAFSKINNINFVFDGFKNISHYQHNNFKSEQFNKMWDSFFNFPLSTLGDTNYKLIEIENLDDSLVRSLNSENSYLLYIQPWKTNSYMDKNIKFVEQKNVIRELKKNIYLHDDYKYYTNNKFNVAIHIRSQNTIDTLASQPHREVLLNNSSNEYFNYYINLFDNIKHFFPENTEIHIYSQGQLKQFEQLKKLNYNINFHLNEQPNITLYHMIHSDLFIAANSSFSYITTLLRDKITICRDNFWHKTYDKTIHTNRNGELLNNFDLLKSV